jgi:hypothetical protein
VNAAPPSPKFSSSSNVQATNYQPDDHDESTAVSQISIKLKEIYQLLEMEVSTRKGKVRWLFDKERYIFEKKDAEVGIIHPLAGIILIFIVRLARSHTLVATSPLLFTTVFSMGTNSWASKIRAFWRKCHLSSSV